MPAHRIPVDTIACEAHEDDVVDHLLAHEGVEAASADLRAEEVRVTLRAGLDPTVLEPRLRFLGLRVRG